MTSSATALDRAHPIAVALSGFEQELHALRDRPTWIMTPAETRDAMVAVTRVQARIAELEARLAAHGQTVEVEAESGATSTANWWAHETRMTRAAAHRRTRLATALAKEVHEPVRVALADGRLLAEQAEVIVAAIGELPEDLDPEIRDRAQAELVDRATEFDAKALRILGRRILDVVAPEVGEGHEATLLEKEEREAAAKASLRMRDDGPGKTYGRFTLPTWSRGGDTDLKNGRLLCPRHHARAHDPTYTITHHPEGKVRFHRRT